MEPSRQTPETPSSSTLDVALLTGCGDRPYAFGLATALIDKGVRLDIIGGDDLESPQFRNRQTVRFLNLRGSQRSNVRSAAKALRVLGYYGRVLRYAATARPRAFHLLWNNKFEAFDRTLLMLYYKLLGKKLLLTVHNVNAGKRDATDSALNRLTLGVQYRLVDRLFVHTQLMKRELVEEFGVRADLVSVIPFGINNDVPQTDLTCAEARSRVGLQPDDKAMLFFGNITPYKGLDCLLEAWQMLSHKDPAYRLVIAGSMKAGSESHWRDIREHIRNSANHERIIQRIEYIRNDQTEWYFKAADVLVLPYRHIFQSGVLFLGYSFGLPVVATDVGSLREDIIEGENGFLCKPEDPADLARAIERYFTSPLFHSLPQRRSGIRDAALRRNSWDTVGQLTTEAYGALTSD
jgi:D-inositol-3-phosphate glycosyltransferase